MTATADTPVAGTPPRPVTCTEMDPSAGTGPDAPVPVLVSSSRAVNTETIAPEVVGGAVTVTACVTVAVLPTALVTVSLTW